MLIILLHAGKLTDADVIVFSVFSEAIEVDLPQFLQAQGSKLENYCSLDIASISDLQQAQQRSADHDSTLE